MNDPALLVNATMVCTLNFYVSPGTTLHRFLISGKISPLSTSRSDGTPDLASRQTSTFFNFDITAQVSNSWKISPLSTNQLGCAEATQVLHRLNLAST